MNDDADLDGMTVNERLLHCGLFPAFDAAMAARDRAAVIEVLRRANLTEEQAEITATATLANPAKYGFY